MPVVREGMFYIRGKISCAPRFFRLCGDRSFAFLSLDVYVLRYALLFYTPVYRM